MGLVTYEVTTEGLLIAQVSRRLTIVSSMQKQEYRLLGFHSNKALGTRRK